MGEHYNSGTEGKRSGKLYPRGNYETVVDQETMILIHNYHL